ncbi:uncharacterized protein RSE6_07020 [Rhynchosporium secalis]|uniref:F-box domain-containing protein n=1 Tax=Rhynchosporium secalis TaxID=38038 RepID=A0A1E1MBV8_RHYSE|nr:uncharacterized protein RSE6_07020 [Rhynchosporium secalis]
MPSFLDLPREIRDEIYIYSLTCPRGLLSAYLLSRPPTLNSKRRVKVSKRKKSNKQHLHLITSPLSLPPNDPIFDKPDMFLSHNKNDYITLSLPSTCRQIYNETQGMFWRQNTFYFAAINESGRSLGISRTLKVMGQVASRMIQNLTIRMPNHSIEYVGFGKVIKTLGSRARLGHFRKLEMAWNAAAIVDLMNMSSLNTPQDFEGSLDEMSEAFDGVRFERVVRISTYPRSTGDIQNERDEENVESIYKLFGEWIHYAVGGTLICDGKVEWINGVHLRLD